MRPNVGEPTASKYRLLHGDVGRTVKGAEARRRIHREVHGMIVGVSTGRRWPTGAHWWNDSKRGRLHPLVGVLRLIDVLVMSGYSRDEVLHVTEMLAWYLSDRIEERDAKLRPAEPEKAA